MPDQCQPGWSRQMSIFDTPVDRAGTDSAKWAKYQGRDIIPMWVADADFRTAPVVIEALQARVAHGVFGYPLQPTAGVREAIRGHLASRYGWDIERDWILPLPSLVSGLYMASLMTAPGEQILVPGTIYPPFLSMPERAGRPMQTVPMRLEGERWVLDLARLEASITGASRLLLFCNPHNPGGTVYRREELEALADICRRHDLLVCSDEIHCDLVLDDGLAHVPFATLNEDAAARSIILMAASKTYNIAGLGFGFAIVPDAGLRQRYGDLVARRLPEVNILGQTATEAALRHGESWRREQIAYLRENRDFLYRELGSLDGMKMYLPEATYLAWIDVSGLGLDDPPAFFEEAGVGIAAGAYYGDPRFIRLNFACPRALLEEAVARIRRALEQR